MQVWALQAPFRILEQAAWIGGPRSQHLLIYTCVQVVWKASLTDGMLVAFMWLEP